MAPVLVGHQGLLAGERIPILDTRVTFGRNSDNTVVISSLSVSRFHAEIVFDENEGYVLHDCGSSNGTQVNGEDVESRLLQSGDEITMGDQEFRFEVADAMETLMALSLPRSVTHGAEESESGPVLRVTVAGGGPVGLSFALLLEHFLGPQAQITVYDGRWRKQGRTIVWKGQDEGNVRRQQVVTVQSRQYLAWPEEVRARLFDPEHYSEMWPSGPDSIGDHHPRNMRIAYIEDRLLELANEKRERIRLIPTRFDPAEQQDALATQHVLAICDGGRSHTREHFAARFGKADESIYSLDGRHLQDVVLGLRVKSTLSDPMAVLLTVAQNRFLLNSLRGEGFLNMRLTDAELSEVIGIDPVRRVFEECIASRPCLMDRDEHGDFQCSTHGTLFLPALIKGSSLWKRVHEGLRLFGVESEDLTAVTSFRLDMVQRPRFSAELMPATAGSPGTYGFLLGDAANAIHFWPGRGLNSGLASAISLARSLNGAWSGKAFRDADFLRHEAAMSMLQYRHKSRAWKAMVTSDDKGATWAIKDIIAHGIDAADDLDRDADTKALLERMRTLRERLAPRLPGMPDDEAILERLQTLEPATLRMLVLSGAWDTLTMGGEEVDIDIFYGQDSSAAAAAVEALEPAVQS
ncbi:FHA domain-containing protein [Streptomyces sp. MI02-2A]|uniref:FHA domain-containing protein n=1 Tax=unclassified Streptomyces TaxID=2593676 RepID=UPI000B1D3CB5|nr:MULTISPECIES: FHA domain-containing protein [unclassified Streptomyces]MDX3263293.1 FHA domain-containing protein [Streptomyces sp. MI02-2A]REE65548.1 FHA domain-containing protein [Streptomyces sp. 3212.3]